MPSSKIPDPFPPIERPEDIDKVIMYFTELFGREITPGERNYLTEVRKKLELRQSSTEYQPNVRHPEIKWNEHSQEWSCTKCARKSDHVRNNDAWNEINAASCEPPAPAKDDRSEH
jgi:hypothetical protein